VQRDAFLDWYLAHTFGYENEEEEEGGGGLKQASPRERGRGGEEEGARPKQASRRQAQEEEEEEGEGEEVQSFGAGGMSDLSDDEVYMYKVPARDFGQKVSQAIEGPPIPGSVARAVRGGVGEGEEEGEGEEDDF
jgi:hypothetical protein